MCDSAGDVYEGADMIIKVKEPIEIEYNRLKEGQILFTYLHLAADRALTEEVLCRKELPHWPIKDP